jgi:hypothetical protein
LAINKAINGLTSCFIGDFFDGISNTVGFIKYTAASDTGLLLDHLYNNVSLRLLLCGRN